MYRFVLIAILWGLSRLSGQCTLPLSDNFTEKRQLEIDYSGNRCGINSVYIAFKLLGVNLNYDNVTDGVAIDYKNGVSIKQLKDIVENRGLYSKSGHYDFKSIIKYRDAVFVLRVSGSDNDLGHFVVARSISNDEIQIIDPPARPYLISEYSNISSPGLMIVTSRSEMFGVFFREESFGVLEHLSK